MPVKVDMGPPFRVGNWVERGPRTPTWHSCGNLLITYFVSGFIDEHAGLEREGGFAKVL